MRTRDSLVLIAALSAISFFWAVGSTIAQDDVGEVGRYQAPVGWKQEWANRLFITGAKKISKIGHWDPKTIDGIRCMGWFL